VQQKAGKSKAGNRQDQLPKLSCLEREFCPPVGTHPYCHPELVEGYITPLFYQRSRLLLAKTQIKAHLYGRFLISLNTFGGLLMEHKTHHFSQEEKIEETIGVYMSSPV